MTCLHRLVSALGVEIYSRGQSTDGCSVDMTDRGWEEGKKVDDVGIVGKQVET